MWKLSGETSWLEFQKKVGNHAPRSSFHRSLAIQNFECEMQEGGLSVTFDSKRTSITITFQNPNVKGFR